MRTVLVAVFLGVLIGCNFTPAAPLDAADVPAPPDPDCIADKYAYFGQTTMAALGVSRPSGRPPPDATRVGTIWVTADRRFNEGEPPGMSEGRMLCIEFPDDGGQIGAMTNFPVVDSWRAPGLVEGIEVATSVPAQLLLVGLGAALLTAVVLVAFRERR